MWFESTAEQKTSLNLLCALRLFIVLRILFLKRCRNLGISLLWFKKYTEILGQALVSSNVYRTTAL